MKVLDWINSISQRNLICQDYLDRLGNVKTKKQFMDIALDPNGAWLICKMRTLNRPLPYEVIHEEFGRYINANYIKDDKGYTSSLYCQYNQMSLEPFTTFVILLDCHTEIYINPLDVTKVLLDSNCDVKIYCPSSSICYIDYFEGAKIEIIEGEDRVNLKKVD